MFPIFFPVWKKKQKIGENRRTCRIFEQYLVLLERFFSTDFENHKIYSARKLFLRLRTKYILLFFFIQLKNDGSHSKERLEKPQKLCFFYNFCILDRNN